MLLLIIFVYYNFYLYQLDNTKGYDDDILKKIATPEFLDIHINAAQSIVKV